MLRKGNRESTVQRKLKFLKGLKGSPEDMIRQVLSKNWVDRSKKNAIDVICQYAEFLGIPIKKPDFRAYDNREMFVPNPEMVKQFLYRLRSIKLRAVVLTAIETGATAGEIFNLTWKDINFQNKTITIRGIKGHRTYTYPISDELTTLLLQLPKTEDRIFNYKDADNINDFVEDYRKRLAKETGNPDFLKIHFHTFRHYAISWHYFKTKDIVKTQRFARHCNIQNTLRYVHIVKNWIKENEFDVVYAEGKAELTKYLAEGYELVAKTEWGYCLRKPKTIT
ncbi:MAG: tyrosine-type recombinase/integrase [Candidatus Bathyarchaeia archaeon]